jgi:hypothetical protein
MYPIGKFIQDTMLSHGIKRSALPKLLGYQNASKVLRHFDRLMDSGRFTPEFQKRLVAALKVDPTLFETAVAGTREIKCDEARQRRDADFDRSRASFRPHLRVLPESPLPAQIFYAHFCVNHWLMRPLPHDILTMPVVHRLRMVGEMAREHYATEGGRAGSFGTIQGYLFRTEFEKGTEFNTDGVPVAELEGPVEGGRLTLWISGWEFNMAEMVEQQNL